MFFLLQNIAFASCPPPPLFFPFPTFPLLHSRNWSSTLRHANNKKRDVWSRSTDLSTWGTFDDRNLCFHAEQPNFKDEKPLVTNCKRTAADFRNEEWKLRKLCHIRRCLRVTEIKFQGHNGSAFVQQQQHKQWNHRPLLEMVLALFFLLHHHGTRHWSYEGYLWVIFKQDCAHASYSIRL